MAQLIFHQNQVALNNIISWSASHLTMSFFPINPSDSISWVNLWFFIYNGGGNQSFQIGLYSLTASTLSLANSISGTDGQAASHYIAMNNTSATQNITPGNWWLGFNYSAAVALTNVRLFGQKLGMNAPTNAFPGSFIGGRMTQSTSAIPSSVATSVLNITGDNVVNVPFIILNT